MQASSLRHCLTNRVKEPTVVLPPLLLLFLFVPWCLRGLTLYSRLTRSEQMVQRLVSDLTNREPGREVPYPTVVNIGPARG